MGWFSRNKGLSCAFCKKPRAEVRHLVAGDDVAICSDCVALAVQVLPAGEGETLVCSTIEQWVTSLPPTTPLAQSRRLLTVGIQLHGDHSAQRRGWANQAFRLRAYDVAHERLAGLDELSDGDRINLSVACFWLRTFREGIEYLDGIHETTATPEHVALLFNNRASLHAGLAAEDPAALARAGQDAERAAALIERLPESNVLRAYSQTYLNGTRAQIALLRGDLQAAEKWITSTLETLDATDRGHAYRRRIHGDVLWAQGRRHDARTCWQGALTTLPPDDDEAILLRARLDRGPPGGGAIAEG